MGDHSSGVGYAVVFSFLHSPEGPSKRGGGLCCDGGERLGEGQTASGEGIWLSPASGQLKVKFASSESGSSVLHGAEGPPPPPGFYIPTAVKPLPASLCTTDFLKTQIGTFSLFYYRHWPSILMEIILTLDLCDRLHSLFLPDLCKGLPWQLLNPDLEQIRSRLD